MTEKVARRVLFECCVTSTNVQKISSLTTLRPAGDEEDEEDDDDDIEGGTKRAAEDDDDDDEVRRRSLTYATKSPIRSRSRQLTNSSSSSPPGRRRNQEAENRRRRLMRFPPRHPAEPLPDSSPLTGFICHRWGGGRTNLKEKIIIKKIQHGH